MKRGLFYNSLRGTCSIWETGRMCYEALKTSSYYNLEYSEAKKWEPGYDFYVVNWHHATCNWIKEDTIKACSVPTFAIVTEVCYDVTKTVTSLSCPGFTKYMVLDPTVTENSSTLAFTRPLEFVDLDKQPRITRQDELECPLIGSFGFATDGKEWHKIIEAVQAEYNSAVIRLNIPHATFVPNNARRIQDVKAKCQAVTRKPGIRLEITERLMNPEELVKWCEENTLNIFLYSRSSSHKFVNGLCATTDQAVASRRPLLVSRDPTFRHIHKYLKPYPEITIREAINSTQNIVCQIAQDWHSTTFRNKFENALKSSILRIL